MCEESWKDCAEWLTRCGLLPPEHRAQTSIKDLAYTLRDGVQLCRLLNCLQSNALDLKEISLKPQMAQVGQSDSHSCDFNLNRRMLRELTIFIYFLL